MIAIRILFPILLGFFLMYAVQRSWAHDPDNPALNDWYQSLHSNSGSPCCDGKDFDKGTAAHVETENWETQNKTDSHFRVRLDGTWEDVPDSAVVSVPNKDGRALVWFYTARGWKNPDSIAHIIRCFMPGTMS